MKPEEDGREKLKGCEAWEENSLACFSIWYILGAVLDTNHFKNIFQDVLHRDTLVKAFLDQVFHLKPGLSLRSTFLAQFLLVLHRKALTLIKYIEDDTQKGKKPFKSLRNLKIDLDLTAEGDLNIIMALAEKIKPGLHSFIFGRPFYTSVQERDVLMTF
ncbi:guanine nucleotide exchange factor C9orf72 homolog [Marmota marmota marmota]|uniref:guanine nucleotide exchange factor C9orf72 homolog n=1 Tax=Marmota marmota marmota TaxID=9994 RepID=UPI002091F460|nr:guanine nucleotide exchange factor C9orf72 homolog [Marmota marmota marmota]